MPAKFLILIVLLAAAACTAKNAPSGRPAPQPADPGPTITAPDPWLLRGPNDRPR